MLGGPEYELEPPPPTTAPLAGELDEDGYQRPGAAAPAAVLSAAALGRFRLSVDEQADDSMSLLTI